MCHPKLMLAACVALWVFTADGVSLPAASPNAASHVTASLQVDSETDVTSLVITGEHKNNSIVIWEEDGTIYVLGQAKTKVNNRKTAAAFDGTNVTVLVLDMGKGNDTVLIELDVGATATLDADGGAGTTDSLTVTGTIDPAATIIVTGFETLDPPDLGL